MYCTFYMAGVCPQLRPPSAAMLTPPQQKWPSHKALDSRHQQIPLSTEDGPGQRRQLRQLRQLRHPNRDRRRLPPLQLRLPGRQMLMEEAVSSSSLILRVKLKASIISLRLIQSCILIFWDGGNRDYRGKGECSR